MKVLFASAAYSPDMAANFLWDGLQAALGTQNVADATIGTALRGAPEGWWANDRPVRWNRFGHRIPQPDEDDFDMLVATPTFLRDHDWEWLGNIIATKLKKDGKVVWFETLDGANDIFTPQVTVDAVFRREIDPGVHYPYEHKPLALLCAIPERWLTDPVFGWTDEKPYDVFNVSNAYTTGHPTRWSSLAPTFATGRRHQSLAGCGVLQPNTVYLHVARMFKLIIEAPGGAAASDNGHFWEGISLGGIPIIVEQPCRPRWPWFTGDHCFWCDKIENLPAVIEVALDTDLNSMRLRLKRQVLEYHTTKCRAEQFLRMIREDAYKGAHGPWRW